MATNFAEAAIKIVADGSSLNKQLAGIQEAFADAGKRMGQALTTGILAGTAAIAAATTGLALMVKGVADAGDEINKLSQRVAIGAATLSGYKLAAQLSDLSLQDFAANLQKLSKNMLGASEESAGAQKAFTALGISVTDQAGKLKTAEQVMLEVADRFARMEDGAQKTALAMELFGKAGAAMIPLLNQGKAALEAQRKEAQLFGTTFTTTSAKIAEELNDTLTRITAGVKGFVTQVGQLLLPLANEVLGALLAKLKELAESGQLRIWAVQTAEVIVRGFVWAAQAVGSLVQASTVVIDAFRVIAAAFRTLETGMEEAIGRILQALAKVAGAIALWDEIQHPFTKGSELSRGLRDFQQWAEQTSATFTTASQQAAEFASAWWNAIGTSNAAADAFAKKLEAMGKSVEEWAGKALAAGIKAAYGIGETGKAAQQAGGHWEELEFQIDGVTRKLRVWVDELKKALPQRVGAELGPLFGAPAPGQPAPPGSLTGIVERANVIPAAEPTDIEGEARPQTGHEFAASFGQSWQEVLRNLAGQGRSDLLEGIMGRFGPEGNLPGQGMITQVLGSEQAQLQSPAAQMPSQIAEAMAKANTVFDEGMSAMEARLDRGIRYVDQRLPGVIESWFVERLMREMKRA